MCPDRELRAPLDTSCEDFEAPNPLPPIGSKKWAWYRVVAHVYGLKDEVSGGQYTLYKTSSGHWDIMYNNTGGTNIIATAVNSRTLAKRIVELEIRRQWRIKDNEVTL